MKFIKLAKKCTINIGRNDRIILNSLTYATRKLWNVANYERKQWTKSSGIPYPNWYDQKKRLKSHFWYKNLPSQSAQELLAVLHRSWKSFYRLKESGGIENPRSPRYKHDNYNIKYLKDGFKVLSGNKVRFSIPKQLKLYLKEKYGLQENYLLVDVPNHLQLESYKIKTIEIRPLQNGKYELIFVIEIPDIEPKEINYQRFMSIDIGVNNFMACYIYNGACRIYSGRQFLSVNRYFDKTIAYYKSISDTEQKNRGVKYPKQSKKVNRLYEKRSKQIEHLLHCMTRSVIDTAIAKNVTVIFIGDITHILDSAKFGKKTNQKFHKLPYRKAIKQLKYKALLAGIKVMDNVKENYTSQTCCLCKDTPSKKNAVKSNRKYRGLYICRDCGSIINADINRAVNIAKKYLKSLNTDEAHALRIELPVVVLDRPVMFRFNGQMFVA